MRKSFIFILLTMVVAVILAILPVPPSVALSILIFIALIYVFQSLSPLLFSRDVDKINKYLEGYLHQPTYYFLYTFVNRNEENFEDAMSKIRKKIKSDEKRSVFEVMHAYYLGDYKRALSLAQKIPQSDYKYYYLAMIHNALGNTEECENYLQGIKKGWMAVAVKAMQAERRGEIEAALNYIDLGLNETRGLNYYSLAKEKERVERLSTSPQADFSQTDRTTL